MAKATVRLDAEDQQLLEQLAPVFGGRAATVREALQRLAADHGRKEALSAFFEEWEAESGPLDPGEVAAACDLRLVAFEDAGIPRFTNLYAFR